MKSISGPQNAIRKSQSVLKKHGKTVGCSLESALTSYNFRKILVVFIITDFVTLQSLFDTVLTQNIYIALVFSFSATLAYNYLPIVISSEINSIRFEKPHKPVMLIIYSVLFSVIVAITAALSLSTKDQLFVSVFGGSEDYSSIMNSLSVSSDSLTADICVWTMALIPVATSMISMYVSLKDTPCVVRLHKLTTARNKLEVSLVQLNAERAKLDRDFEAELRAWDTLSRRSFLERAQCKAESNRLFYRTLLMMLNRSPDAISFNSEKILGSDNDMCIPCMEEFKDLAEF